MSIARSSHTGCRRMCRRWMDEWKNGITGTVDDCDDAAADDDDGHGVDDTMIAKTNRWCEISCIQVYIKFMRMKKKANKNQNIKKK